MSDPHLHHFGGTEESVMGMKPKSELAPAAGSVELPDGFGDDEISRALKAREDSAAQLEGFRAAALMVEKFLNDAEKNRPKRGAHGKRSAAAFREGYYHGLLFAHSMHTFGEFPHKNIEPIRTILSQNAPR